jgi:hypothetical protein
MFNLRALIVAWVVILAPPGQAWACSYAASLKLDGYPGDGAEGVPTDVIPVYVAPASTAAGAVEAATLTSERGADVLLTVRTAEQTHVELAPAGALEPNTRYTLSVTWAASNYVATSSKETLSFTTGTGPFAGGTSAPRVAIEHYQVERYLGCNLLTNSCVMLDDREVFLVDYKWLLRGSFFNNSYGAAECTRVQRRLPNGQFSETSTICTQDGPLYDLRQRSLEQTDPGVTVTCTQEGIKWTGSLVRGTADAEVPAPHTYPGAEGGVPLLVDGGPTSAADGGMPIDAILDAAFVPDGATNYLAPDGSVEISHQLFPVAADSQEGSDAANARDQGCSVGSAAGSAAPPPIELLALLAACVWPRRRRSSRLAGSATVELTAKPCSPRTR